MTATAVRTTRRSRRARRRRNPVVMTLAYLVVAAFIFDAVFSKVLVPHNPLAQNLIHNLKRPGGPGGFLGTDQLGRDEFSRVLGGVRPVLEIVAASVALGSVVGLIYGLIAGLNETWVSVVMARFVDMMLSIPGIVLAILLAFVLRPSLNTTIVVVAVVTWPGLARLVRAEVLQIRHSQYVELGVAAGLSWTRLVIHHVVPNILNTFVAFLVLDMAVAIQLEAGLSFLGYGVQPPAAELGSMLASSLTYLNQWWLAVFPGVALTLLILSITYVGQDVRDRLDPRQADRRQMTGAGGDEPDLVPMVPLPDALVAPAVPAPESPVPAAAPALDAGAVGTPALAVQHLTVRSDRNQQRVVDDVSFQVRQGGVVAVVGESGSGKSSLCLAVLGLLSPGLRVTGGTVEYDSAVIDLAHKSAAAQLRPLRGREVGLVLQDPLSSLDPVRKVGFQLYETRLAHGLGRGRGGRGRGREERRSWEVARLRSLGFMKPAQTARAYPSALSGGMRQRVCIGIASSANPKVVLADEPTTALDASLRGRVLRLLLEMCRADNTALVFVTHDLEIVRSLAEQVLVMYGGMVLEDGPISEVFRQPRSPYTQALLVSSITLDQAEHGIAVPAIDDSEAEPGPQVGCPFAHRCPLADDLCRTQRPILSPVNHAAHRVACWHHQDAVGAAPQGVSHAR